MTGEILAAVEAARPWSLDLLGRLVAEPSVTGRRSGVDTLLAAELRALGFDVEIVPCDPSSWADDPEYSPPALVEDGAPVTLVARSRTSMADTPLLLFAHTDTEPVHEGWNTDPFDLRMDDGRLSGLGVADDLAGVVNILAAVRVVLDTGVPFGVEPVLVLGPGKQGGALGTLPGVARAAPVERALYVHPPETGNGLTELKSGSRGIATYTLTVPGHTPAPVEERTPVSADPHDGANAATRAARLVARLDAGGPASGTWAVTGLRTQAAPFEVPGHAAVDVAAWFTDGTVDARTADLTAWLRDEPGDRFETEHPVGVELTGLRANPAVCRDQDWIDAVAGTVEELTSHRPGRYDGHAASDIRFPLRRYGVPTVGLGARAGGFYGSGEWVDERSWHLTTAVVAALLSGRQSPAPPAARARDRKGQSGWSGQNGGNAGHGGEDPRWTPAR